MIYAEAGRAIQQSGDEGHSSSQKGNCLFITDLIKMIYNFK